MLAPETIFYVDGILSTNPELPPVLGNRIEVSDAIFCMDSAIVTASCDNVWEGIFLDNSTTTGVQILNSEISFAENGLTDKTQSREEIIAITNTIPAIVTEPHSIMEIEGSRFINNEFSNIKIDNGGHSLSDNDKIKDNTISYSSALAKEPFASSSRTRSGIVARYLTFTPSSAGIEGNQILNTIDGIVITDANALVCHNTINFTSTGIDVQTFTAHRNVTVTANTLTRGPSNNSFPVGIDLGDGEMLVDSNIIIGNSFGDGIDGPNFGINNIFNQGNTRILSNEIVDFDCAIQSTGRNIGSLEVIDNLMVNNRVGLDHHPFQFSFENMSFRCNSIEVNPSLYDTAFAVLNNDVARLSFDQSALELPGNSFSGFGGNGKIAILQENNLYSLVYLVAGNETAPSSEGQIFVQPLTQSVTCSMEGFANGNGRVETESGMEDLQNIIMYQSVGPDTINTLIEKLIFLYQDSGDMEGLEEFNLQLAQCNLEAFNQIALYLLHFHFAQGSALQSDYWKKQLEAFNPTNEEIKQQMKLELLKFNLGQGRGISSTDSLILVNMAASSTTQSYLAIRILDQVFPGYGYEIGHPLHFSNTSCLEPINRIQGTEETFLAEVEAFPNPARDVVSFIVHEAISQQVTLIIKHLGSK